MHREYLEVKIPIKDFVGIEQDLTKLYGISQYSTFISEALTGTAIAMGCLRHPNIKKHTGKDGVPNPLSFAINELEAFHMCLPDGFSFDPLDDFCEEYNINEDSREYEILEFIYILSGRAKIKELTELVETEKDFQDYFEKVRPEMLLLYIALEENKNSDYFKISVGDSKPIRLDTKEPWLQSALSKYLDTYLGVDSVEEAKKELFMVYNYKNNKFGPKMDKNAVRYMWGTYHLLVKRPKNSKSAPLSNLQSRMIHDYLRLLQLPNFPKLDEEQFCARRSAR